MNKINIIIDVSKISKNIHEEDLDVEGKYQVTLNSNEVKDAIADAALDVFHDNIPIKILEDFEFSICDNNGKELFLNPNHEDYSLSHTGTVFKF